jgi:hypothetical protein
MLYLLPFMLVVCAFSALTYTVFVLYGRPHRRALAAAAVMFSGLTFYVLTMHILIERSLR